MILDGGKRKIIALIDDNLSTGSLGTSSQAVVATDTGLIAEVTSTIDTISGTQNNKQLIIDYELDSTAGNGNSYTEYANKFTDGTSFNRIVFTAVPKNSAIEFQVKTIVNYP